MIEQKNGGKSLGMLISAMFIFGTIGIFRRYIPLSSSVLACVRGLLGAIVLSFYVKARGRKLIHPVGSKKILWLALTGVLMGFNWILLFEAFNYTTVSIATLCYYMEPIIVILISAFLFKEKLSLKKGLCSVVALIGMVFVSGVYNHGVSQEGELKGVLFALGASCLYSAVVLINKKVSGIDSYEKTIIQLLAAAIVLIPYVLTTEDITRIRLDGKTIVILIIVGVVHTGVSYALYFASMDGLKTQTIAIFSYIDPITALILSVVVLNEKMSMLGILGAVMILGAAILSELNISSILPSKF